MIAVKREVAAHCGRFSVERMSSYETDDKSLYNLPSAICRDDRRMVASKE